MTQLISPTISANREVSNLSNSHLLSAEDGTNVDVWTLEDLQDTVQAYFTYAQQYGQSNDPQYAGADDLGQDPPVDHEARGQSIRDMTNAMDQAEHEHG